ncbi:MAG: 30S ribosomal protein S7 [bacterium]|nr:30S ribosomal protein S7 [bacterium]
MPRRGHVPRRDIEPDTVHGSVTVARFINKVMMRGKKGMAERTFSRAMAIVEEKSGKDALSVFEQALRNATPFLEVKARRVGGSTYQVPVEVRPERRTSLAMRWLLAYARQRPERTMEQRLAGEILDAAAGTGGAVKKREDTHRMAEANKAFAHYRW